MIKKIINTRSGFNFLLFNENFIFVGALIIIK